MVPNAVKSEFITKQRYRVNWFGKMILQVFEQNYKYSTEMYRNAEGGWRDARTADFLEVV